MIRYQTIDDLPARHRGRVESRLAERGKADQKRQANRSRLESLAERVIADAGLPAPVREHPAIPGRRHRWDLAWPDQRVAVEVQGGTWTHGRHVRGVGYEVDCMKMTAGQVLGWTVLYATERMLRRGDTVAALRAIFGLCSADDALVEIFPPNPARKEIRRKGECMEAVMVALDNGPTFAELALACDVEREQISVLLRRLIRQGRVEQTGTRGKYRYWRTGDEK